MKLILTLILLSVASSAFAQEAINLTSPIAVPAIASYTPLKLELRVSPDPQIIVYVKDTNGKEEVFTYPCVVGGTCATTTAAQTLALINALNTANLSTRSLWRRVFDRLVADFPSRFPGGATVP